MSNLIDEFDNNFENEGGIRHAIIDIVESRRADTPSIRMVGEDVLFQVAERSLATNSDLPSDIRYFAALREVNNFITYATEGPVSETVSKHSDLLPVAHPDSSAESIMTASARRMVQAQWIAADPRITDESVRAIVASVYESNPMSIDYAYNLSRLQSLEEGQVPADLLIAPLLAFGDPYAGKNSSWHRSMRAKKQRRDDEGQFAEMGGGYRFYVRMLNGQIMSVVGKVAGIPENNPTGIDVEVTGVRGIRDGIYTIPSEYGHAFKAILPEHAVKKAIRVANQGVEYVDVKDLVRKELPTSWFSAKTIEDNTGLNRVSGGRSFATGDGYQAQMFVRPSQSLMERIEAAYGKFGATVLSFSGTDTLDPDRPIYELLSTKRGQQEVVGYAQDWASVQKLASDEDDNYPNAENEPIAQEMVEGPGKGKKKPKLTVVPDVEQEVTDADLPENVEGETEEDESYDPVKNMPEGWKHGGDNVFRSKDGSLMAFYGSTILDQENLEIYELESPEDFYYGVGGTAIGNAFTIFDAASGANMGIAFDWESVEYLGDMVAGHPSDEPTPQEMAAEKINTRELLPEREKFIQPTEQVANAADANISLNDWNDPKAGFNRMQMVNGFREHQVTDEMIDMWDEIQSSYWRFNVAQAKTLWIAMKAMPKRPAVIEQVTAGKRQAIRNALKHRQIPEDQAKEVSENYRQYTKDQIELAILSLNTYPMKASSAVGKQKIDKDAKDGGVDKTAPGVQEEAEKAAAVAYPVFAGTMKALNAAFANHIVSHEDIELFDAIHRNPNGHSNDFVQEFLDKINALPQSANMLASADQRNTLRDFTSREGVPANMREDILENFLDYKYREADAKIKQLTHYIDLQEQEGRRKTADEIARERGLPRATPEYLETDLVDGQNPPRPRMLVMMESLIQNRDFSDEVSKDRLDMYIKFHRGLNWVDTQAYIKEFSKLPFKPEYQPRMLTTNLTIETGGPTPRQLRSLERKYVKGLISETEWDDIVKAVPDMKGVELGAKYISSYDDLETKYDDAILKQSIEGGYEIEGLRIPPKTTVTIPEDYVPSNPGKWIARTEAEIEEAIGKLGGTPDIIDYVALGSDDISTIDKREMQQAFRREALRDDLRKIRAVLSAAGAEISDSLLNTPKKVLKADARKILQNALSEIYGLKAIMNMRRRFILNEREFNKRLTGIAQAILPGDDSASTYGTLKTRTPEVLDILQRAQAATAAAIGQYKAGLMTDDEIDTKIQEMASSEQPSMKFFYPPTFTGDVLDPLKGMSNYNEILDFLKGQDIYVVDLETTGLTDLDDPDIKNDPIQVAVTKLSGLEPVDSFTTYINPESKLSSYTLMGVGDGKGGKVTQDFLETFPTKREAMERLLEFIPRGSIIAGHNSTLFDMEVLDRTMTDAGLEPLNPGGYIDTLGLARYMMPEWTPANPDAPFKINKYGQQTKSFSLEALVTYFGLSNNGRHEADADVASTVEVFNKMLDRGARGLAVAGPNFNYEGAVNGWSREEYEAAKDVYAQKAAEYQIGRASDILSISGMSPGQVDTVLNSLIDAVASGMISGQEDDREPVNIPNVNPTKELHAGSYVTDVNSGRVGISLGIVGDHVLVDMPAADILASGKFIIENLLPEVLAKVTDKFRSKGGVYLDYGMQVKSSKLPGGLGYVVGLGSEGNNVQIGAGSDIVSVPARQVDVVPFTSDAGAASPKQESMIVNLADQLVSSGIMDRSSASGFVKAAEGHFYSKEGADKIIMRLTTAVSQIKQLEANNDIDVPEGKHSVAQSDIQEMAIRKPKAPVDAKKAKDIEFSEDILKAMEELDMKPTEEGKAIIAAIANGWSVVIKALAGVGKTTNLRMAAQVIQKLYPALRILYITFNKENQLEAEQKMPGNTEPRTSDSISFTADINKGLKVKYDQAEQYPEGLINPYNEMALAEAFVPKDVEISDKRKVMKTSFAGYSYKVLDNWMKSGDKAINRSHVDSIEFPPAYKPVTQDDYDAYIRTAQFMWADVLSDEGQIILSHTHLFKNWALSDPDLTVFDSNGRSPHGLKKAPSILFLDEAQDINPVFLKVILDQQRLHKNGIQIVAVGDKNQKIFGFRGTADSLGVIDRDVTLPLTKSFRTGDGILQLANKILSILGEKLRLVGRDGDGSSIVPSGTMRDPDLIITRTNYGIIEAALWADELFPGERVASTANLKDRLMTVLRTLEWMYYGSKPERKPKRLARELLGFPTWDSLMNATKSENADPQLKTILGLLGKTQKRIRGKYLSEAIDELKTMVGNFRVQNTDFHVPEVVGKGGELGGGIKYEIRKDKLVINGSYSRKAKSNHGVYANRVAIEDAGFERSEEKEKDSQFAKMEWTAQVKGDVRKQLARLVSALRGEDAKIRIMTGHTSKGLEAPKVKIWSDWGKGNAAMTENDASIEGDAADSDVAQADELINNITDEDMNLFYVVLTRAMDELDPGSLAWLMDSELQERVRKNFKKQAQEEGDTPAQEMASTRRDLSAEYKAEYDRKVKRLERAIAEQKEQLSLPVGDRIDGLDNKAIEESIGNLQGDLDKLMADPQGATFVKDKEEHNNLVDLATALREAIGRGEMLSDWEDKTTAERVYTRVNGFGANKLPTPAIPRNRALLEAVEKEIERLAIKTGYANQLDSSTEIDRQGDTEIQNMETSGGSGVAYPNVTDYQLYKVVNDAAEFYNNRLMKFSDATPAADYIKSRGFAKKDAEAFNLGYAPAGWANLYQHLKKNGYTEEEMLASGLIKQSSKSGKYFDALRDRIVFPVIDLYGKPVGFVGRSVDPDEPIRYMRTSGSPINQKGKMLHGMDKAQDQIARTGEMIVVEGQFDLMAMHAAGIDNAVATSGTAFNENHLNLFKTAAWQHTKETGGKGSSIVFAFDSDEAGLKAAERAYEIVKGSGVDTYVVSNESGLDPADIYSKDNEKGLETLLDNKKPMIEFLIERILSTLNVSTPEGKQEAINAIADLLNGVDDQNAVFDLVGKYATRLGMSQNEFMDQIK